MSKYTQGPESDKVFWRIWSAMVVVVTAITIVAIIFA